MTQAVAALFDGEQAFCDADDKFRPLEKVADVSKQDHTNPIEAEWEASLSLVRQAASTVRAMHQRAHTIALEAHQGIQRSMDIARMAEERAQQAAASARIASEHAEQAEALLGTMTAKLQITEKRMHDAEMQASLAQERLKVMCDRIADEFDSLTISPLEQRLPAKTQSATLKSSRPDVRNVRPILPIVNRAVQPPVRGSGWQTRQVR